MDYWENFSKKIREKIDRPRFVGSFTKELAFEKGMRFVTAKEKGVRFDWLVDESDGVIADAKFQAYGPVELIAAAEIASELVIRKTYNQVSRISTDLLDQFVRDQKETAAFPDECNIFLNQVLTVIDMAVEKCVDIPLQRYLPENSYRNRFWENVGGYPWVFRVS